MKVHQFGGKKAMPIHALEQAVLEDWPVSGSGFSYMCSPLIWVSNSLGMNGMLTVIDSESCIFNFKHKFNYNYRGIYCAFQSFPPLSTGKDFFFNTEKCAPTSCRGEPEN